MTPLIYTDEQVLAIACDETDFVITAAAGAGKTTVLVARYLKAVLETSVRPDRILAITFTRKAAAEMKVRVVRQLILAGRSDFAQVAETGPIQTIDSFCERILRENALVAGLDPEFEVLATGRGKRWTQDACRDAIVALAGDPLVTELLEARVGQYSWNQHASPYALLEHAIHTTMGSIRSSGLAIETYTDLAENPDRLKSEGYRIARNLMPEKVRAAFAPLEDDPNFEFDRALFQAYKVAKVKGSGLPPNPNKITMDEQATGLRWTAGLIKLAIDATERFTDRMRAEQSLDFTEMQLKARQLVESHVSVRERIQRQFEIVMVDEAQDLNPLQYRLLDQINPPQLMMVGDPQQSIYGFRMADVELFEDRVKTRTTKRLSTNLRSQAGILRFVDLIFGQAWSDRYQPMTPIPESFDFESDEPSGFEGVEIWNMPQPDARATAGHILELIEEGNAPGDIAVLIRAGSEGIKILDALRSLEVEADLLGGAERFYTRLEVRDLAHAIRSVANPYDDFSLACCLRGPIVGLSLDSLVQLSTTKPIVAALPTFTPALESDQVRLDRFNAWFLPLIQYADRLAAWEVIAELMARSDLLVGLAKGVNADQRIANVRKLLAMATSEPEMTPLEFADQIMDIHELLLKEGDAPIKEHDTKSVSIMTMHKAKGLEFPIVVLPSLQKGALREKQDLILDQREGLLSLKGANSEGTLLFWGLRELAYNRDFREEQRLLYVAMTRAKKRLCLCSYKRAFEGSMNRVVKDGVGTTRLPGVRYRPEVVPETPNDDEF